MNLNSLIQLLQNKLSILQTARGQAYANGDLVQLNVIDKDILETQNTINQLATLSEISKAAESVNTSLANVAVSGIDAIQNPEPVVQGPSASAVINGYDVSAYATDPLYEDKIRAILAKIPTFSIVSDIDTYIQTVAQGSPVTGDMVYKASHQYGVDLPLMMAIMQNDSAFGMLGVGARTNNPGNVGNTGSAERMYNSWQEGVSAVADWLNRHRVVTPTTENVPVVLPVVPVDVDTEATSTPTVVLPTTPVVTATSTATFIIPTVNATTTPVIATSTPPTTSTTTPPILDLGGLGAATSTEATSTNATSTPPDTTASSTPPTNATTTPPILDLGGLGAATSTEATSTNATSTPPDTTSTSTPPTTSTTTPPILDLGGLGAETSTEPVTSTTTDAVSSTTQAVKRILKRKRA